MRPPKQLLVWEFDEELDGNKSSWPSTFIPDNGRAWTNPDQRRQPHVILELLVVIAIMYGLAVYLIWQQNAVRMTTLEQELIVLRQEILRRQALDRSVAEQHETIALAQQIVTSAVVGGKQKPHWQPVTVALQLYLQREIDRPGWQQEEVYLARRQFAAAQPLHLVQQVLVDSGQAEESLQHVPIADELADPFIEFILNMFGYTILPPLLQAFEEHETWETLVPAVFDTSAQDLEEMWHAYLEGRYPNSE